MKIFKIITIVLTSSFLVLPIHIVNTCISSYEWDETRILFFNAALIQENSLTPFFYNFSYLNEHNTLEKEDELINCKEWAEYANVSDLGDVKLAIYKSTLEDYVDQKLNDNKFIAALKAKHPLGYEVLTFAKRNEFANYNDADPWNFKKGYFNQQELIFENDENTQLELQGKGLLDKVKGDAFLEKRIAFQLLRINRFQNDVNEASSLFGYFHSNKSSVIDAWAWMHEAALKYEKDTLGAYLLQAQVFHQSEDKREPSYIAYTRNPITQKKILNLCKDQKMKASIAALNAIDNPGKALKEIKNVYHLDPKNQFLSLLITREISKLDDWIKEFELTGSEPRHNKYIAEKNYFDKEEKEYLDEDGNYIFPTEIQIQQRNSENLANDLIYAKTLINLLEKDVPVVLQRMPDFINISLAHLNNLVENSTATEKYLNKISSTAPSSIKLQVAIEKLLMLPKIKDITQSNVKNEIANNLIFIVHNKNLIDNPTKVISSIETYLSYEFRKKGDIVTAGLLHYKSKIGNVFYDTEPEYGNYYNYPFKAEYNWGQKELDTEDEYEDWQYRESFYRFISFYDRYAKAEDIDELLDIKRNKVKNKLHEYAKPKEWAEDEVYYDLKGTLHFRNSEFKQAANAYSQIQESFWQEKYAFKYYLKNDPFINTYALEKTNKKYQISKTKIALKMDSLTKIIKEQPNAEAYYSLALAYFNTSTYHGNNWIMFNYGQSMYESGGYDYMNGSSFYYQSSLNYFDNYYNNKMVKEFLEKAKSASNSKEITAKIIFLLHTIDDSERFHPTYIEEFITKYNDTKYYQTVKQCLLESDYIK